MLVRFIQWFSTLFTELGEVGKWLFTPIVVNAVESSQDLSQNGIILESSSASIKVHNFFVRLFSNNWDYTTEAAYTFTPINLIGVSLITAILIAMIVKVWFKR